MFNLKNFRVGTYPASLTLLTLTTNTKGSALSTKTLASNNTTKPKHGAYINPTNSKYLLLNYLFIIYIYLLGSVPFRGT